MLKGIFNIDIGHQVPLSLRVSSLLVLSPDVYRPILTTYIHTLYFTLPPSLYTKTYFYIYLFMFRQMSYCSLFASYCTAAVGLLFMLFFFSLPFCFLFLLFLFFYLILFPLNTYCFSLTFFFILFKQYFILYIFNLPWPLKILHLNVLLHHIFLFKNNVLLF